MPTHRLTRRLLFVFGGIAGVALVLLLLLQTPWIRGMLRGVAERQAEAALGADVSIGALRGNLLSHAELLDLRITRNGRPVVTVPEADVSYTLPALLMGAVDVDSVTLREPIIHLRRTEEGVLNLAALGGTRQPEGAKTPAADQPSDTQPGRGWSIADIRIRDGTLMIGDGVITSEAINIPERLTNMTGELTLGSRREGGVRVGIDTLTFRAVAPELMVQQVEGALVIAPDDLRFDELLVATSAGTLAVDGAITSRQTVPTYALEVSAKDLRFPALETLIPALEPYELSPTFEVAAKGPMDALQTRFDVRMQPGAVSGDVTLDLTAPQRGVAGSIRTEKLNLAGLNLGEATDLTLQANVDLDIPQSGLSGVSGTYNVTAPQIQYGQYSAADLRASGRVEGRTIRVDAEAAVYGGTLQTDGTITLPANGGPIDYDLHGQLRNVDPSQLPENVRPAGVSGRRGRGGPMLVPVSTPAEQDQGIDVDFRVSGRGGDVDADVELRDVSLAGADFAERTRVQVSRRDGRLHYSASGAVSSLDLRRLGRELGFDALAGERFASDLNASFDLTGSGTALADLTLRGTATLSDSEVLGVTLPRLFVRPQLTRGAGTIAFDGTFRQLDVGSLTGNRSLDSRLQGAVDAQLALDDLGDPAFSLGAIEASGRLTLKDSSFSGVHLEEATVEASLSDAMARVDVLSLRGPDLDVEASGTLALGRSGTSAFTYLIDTPALQRFETLGVAVKGDVLIKGRIRGNLAQLQTTGTLSGTHVGYGDTSALSIHSTYHIVVPDLEPARARVAATTELAELQAVGRTFAAVNARMEYVDRALEIAARVKDVEQTLAAEGRVVWHPDHQEIHLRTLELDAPDAVWALIADSGATIRYGGSTIAVENFVLTSKAGGRIAVEGEMGSDEDVLTASIRDLQLDSIDDLILEEEPLTGLVQATARIRGTFAEPRVDAQVEITNGDYRDFQYQRAAATVEYAPQLLRLDGQVVQSEGVVFTAKGVVPLSTETGETLNVQVRSTPVDLALVQTFTDELQQVSGNAEVDVTVTGSLTQPLLDGSLNIRGGAFTLVLAQSRYTGLETELTFDRDLVKIREFVLRDDEGNRLRIGGQLPLVDRQAPGVNVRIVSDNFELADNRLMELNADTNLLVTGALLRPRIEGRIGIRESLLRVDRILQLTSGAYEISSAGELSTGSDEPGVFQPTLSLTVAIPDSLVIRGTDIRSPDGGPVGLGDMNITIGGELQVRMEPGRDLTLLGDVQTVRGTYEFQGRQFTIERDGRIMFMGTPDLNPRLDIRARREIAGVIASVAIGGVLEDPELTLSSQPPMEDAEILSLIVFNQPLSLLGTGAQISLASRATALASGFLASQLTESIGNALELDVFEIEAASADGAITPVLTVGEQFGDLWFRLRQRFGPDAVSQAIIEYRLAEWLRLQTSYSQGDAAARSLLRRLEQGGIDLLFFFSY